MAAIVELGYGGLQVLCFSRSGVEFRGSSSPVFVGQTRPEQREGEGERVSERQEGTVSGLNGDSEGLTPIISQCLVVVS